MVLLVGINAQYVHTNLAVRYLRNTLPEQERMLREYSINETVSAVAADIYQTGCKTILFSCYIWNISMVVQLCDCLKKADSSIVTVLGGPEVSFECVDFMQKHPEVDFLLKGEGEASLPLFVNALPKNDFSQVPGLVWRSGDGILENEAPSQVALSQIPFPYLNGEIEALTGRILYYETSRGCPYRCGFCLSSTLGGVRFLPLERAKEEIAQFCRAKVPLVKLVDRTFNANAKRALEMVEFIKEYSSETTFHFEVKAETMTNELIHSLQTAPKGMFQLEIGVQSTNEQTLCAINRKADFEKIARVVRALQKNNNIHLHLDLIAGLPGETLEQFIHSFNDVFLLWPDDLQLGFLKKLKGAGLNTDGSEFTASPPYEVIHSDAMTYADLLALKRVEDMLEKYYNCGSFSKTIRYLIQTYYRQSPYTFFQDLAEWFLQKGQGRRSHSKKSCYELLKQYCDEAFTDEKIVGYITFDYCLHYKDRLSFMESSAELKEQAFFCLKQPYFIETYLRQYQMQKPVELYKKVRFQKIWDRIFLFDCETGVAQDVTEDFT